MTDKSFATKRQSNPKGSRHERVLKGKHPDLIPSTKYEGETCTNATRPEKEEESFPALQESAKEGNKGRKVREEPLYLKAVLANVWPRRNRVMRDELIKRGRPRKSLSRLGPAHPKDRGQDQEASLSREEEANECTAGQGKHAQARGRPERSEGESKGEPL